MDYSPPGSSVHGDSPGKNTGAMPSSRGSSQSWDRTQCLPPCRRILYRLSHHRSRRIQEWVAYSPGDLPNLGIKLRSPAYSVDSLPPELRNIRAKTMKLWEENGGVNLCELGVGKDFLHMTPKYKQPKKK